MLGTPRFINTYHLLMQHPSTNLLSTISRSLLASNIGVTEESLTSQVDKLDQRLAQMSSSIAQPPPDPPFHLFARLPAELRLKIWSFSHPGPRELQISCQKIRVWPSMPKLYVESFKSNHPPTCHVCSESRIEALQIYKPFFRTKRSGCQTFVYFEQDTIVIADANLAYLGIEEMKGIQRIKIRVADCVNFARCHVQTIKDMEALLEVDILMEEWEMSTEGIRCRRNLAALLQEDFIDEMRDDPAWKWPKIRFVGSDTGMILGTLRGGAWIPGWKSGNPIPPYDAVEAYLAFQTGLADL